MYIKITTNTQGQAYYHLVESYRENGKVRQRKLLSLGRVGEDRLNDLIAAIGKHKDVVSALEAAKSVDIDETYILGPLLVLQHIFTRFGIFCLAREHCMLSFKAKI
jgi:hypothetical protein